MTIYQACKHDGNIYFVEYVPGCVHRIFPCTPGPGISRVIYPDQLFAVDRAKINGLNPTTKIYNEWQIIDSLNGLSEIIDDRDTGNTSGDYIAVKSQLTP